MVRGLRDARARAIVCRASSYIEIGVNAPWLAIMRASGRGEMADRLQVYEKFGGWC